MVRRARPRRGASRHRGPHGGWYEHFDADWTPITAADPRGPLIGRPGAKTANAHLHALEALTALHDVHPTDPVRAALEHAVEMTRSHCFPIDVHAAHECFTTHWHPITDPRSRRISYGHRIEFAFLLLEAQRSLREPIHWDLVRTIVDQVLTDGEDHRRGGIVDLGPVRRRLGPSALRSPPRPLRRVLRRLGRPPRSDKTWWVQAEAMAALTELVRHDPLPHHVDALHRLVVFTDAHVRDPVTGVWRTRVAVDGSTVDPTLASDWKNAYHDIRALVRFVEVFDPLDGPVTDHATA